LLDYLPDGELKRHIELLWNKCHDARYLLDLEVRKGSAVE
jgi:hypothetical protein